MKMLGNFNSVYIVDVFDKLSYKDNEIYMFYLFKLFKFSNNLLNSLKHTNIWTTWLYTF